VFDRIVLAHVRTGSRCCSLPGPVLLSAAPFNELLHCPHSRCNVHAAHPLIVVRQRKPFRRKDGLVIYFEDNAGVIVNPKGDLKGARASNGLKVSLPCFGSSLLQGAFVLQDPPLLDQSPKNVLRSGHVSHLRQTASFKAAIGIRRRADSAYPC
jgi:hypothetical protein